MTVFIAPYEKLDERKKVTKLMKEKSIVLLAETPQNQDLDVWIQSEVSKLGKAITTDATQKLVEMVGPNMLQLQMEIEKMALYLGQDHEITVALVEDLVAWENSLFIVLALIYATLRYFARTRFIKM